MSEPTAAIASAREPKLLDRVRAAARVPHLSLRTEKTYVQWIRRYILFHGKRHPAEMGEVEINAFLTHLAVEGRVSASTQTQALCAILFLYRAVLGRDVGGGRMGLAIRLSSSSDLARPAFIRAPPTSSTREAPPTSLP
jgi:Phage integrase, N-terminal SAM-like domain